MAASSLTAAQFLGEMVPIVGLVEAFLTFLLAVFNREHHGQAQLTAAIVLFITNYSAMQRSFLHVATWATSLSLAAVGFTLKAFYELLVAAYALYTSTETNLNRKRREVLLQGLKVIGFCLLSFASISPAVGFIFLASAAMVGLYDNSEHIQRWVGSPLSFLSRLSIFANRQPTTLAPHNNSIINNNYGNAGP